LVGRNRLISGESDNRKLTRYLSNRPAVTYSVEVMTKVRVGE
jgi:hypothetical protein